MFTIYVYVLDALADWELGWVVSYDLVGILPELNNPIHEEIA